MEPWNLTQQSLSSWGPMPFTVEQMKHCELVAEVIMGYRQRSNFITSHCWMDEWATGYLCALRDNGNINNLQWAFLCSVFQPEDLYAR